jgi:hypothetical protein
VPGLPDWFDEGLAEYFGPSRLVSAKGAFEVGVVVKNDPGGRVTRLQRIREALRDGTPCPPRSLRDLMNGKFRDGEHALVDYAHAWSVVHFFLSSERTKKVFKAYFHALKAGKGADVAFAETFGKENLEALEAGWKEYVGRL